jgi:hypothetical protein
MYFIQTSFELINLGFLHQDVLLVKLLDNKVVLVVAVNVDQHGFDGSIALDERACRCQSNQVACTTLRRTSYGFDHGEMSCVGYV